MGYHYPRSITTALKSAGYFERFVEDFGFSINGSFQQVYATSSKLGWTNANEFMDFCEAAKIPCLELPTSRYFKKDVCDGAFLTEEYTYDAMILRDFFIEELSKYPKVQLLLNTRPLSIEEDNGLWDIQCSDGTLLRTPFCLNATYASVNEIHSLINAKPYPVKYELCEIILCEANEDLRDIGITVMDGPFFSIMPFGKTGFHSLTSVTFTPHNSTKATLPTFPCQKSTEGQDEVCSPTNLLNCNHCKFAPDTSWPLMSSLAKKYMREELEFGYVKSLYSVKPIMLASEVDDSRPTVIKEVSEHPRFVSVLSGKINTVYDLDPFLT